MSIWDHWIFGPIRIAIKGDFRKKARRTFEERIGEMTVIERDGTRRVVYGADHDKASYETYRQIQEAGNKHKLRSVFAVEENVAYLARFVERRLGRPVKLGLCHGTRNGAEQRWFLANLTGAPTVIGTEISETATQFPNTIQWDFHETKPEWIGACDFIYSNSWDHSFDPERMFKGWMSCLSENGVLLIEHTRLQDGTNPDPLDPFGATREGLIRLLDRIGSGTFKVVSVIEDLPKTFSGLCVVVVARA